MMVYENSDQKGVSQGVTARGINASTASGNINNLFGFLLDQASGSKP